MTQDTTIEFSKRFAQAVEAHPLSPVSPHGRQRWMLDKLKTETGVVVSPNTMSKWFNGSARPRTDNIRHLARILGVDEVWLAMGKKPVERPEQARVRAANTSGAALLVAGLVEVNGGRVTFPAGSETYDLHINVNGSQFSAVVVTGRSTGDTLECIVPEPVGESRILVVVPQKAKTNDCPSCVSVLDATDAPRQGLGGYSVISICQKSGAFNALEQGKPAGKIGHLKELA